MSVLSLVIIKWKKYDMNGECERGRKSRVKPGTVRMNFFGQKSFDNLRSYHKSTKKHLQLRLIFSLYGKSMAGLRIFISGKKMLRINSRH